MLRASQLRKYVPNENYILNHSRAEAGQKCILRNEVHCNSGSTKTEVEELINSPLSSFWGLIHREMLFGSIKKMFGSNICIFSTIQI